MSKEPGVVGWAVRFPSGLVMAIAAPSEFNLTENDAWHLAFPERGKITEAKRLGAQAIRCEIRGL